MSDIVLIVILGLALVAVSGYYAHSQYGSAGLGGVLGSVIIVLVFLWLFGGGFGRL